MYVCMYVWMDEWMGVCVSGLHHSEATQESGQGQRKGVNQFNALEVPGSVSEGGRRVCYVTMI